MANNRMYLRCKVCGSALFMGKAMASGYWYEGYATGPYTAEDSLEKRLNDFYDAHTFCQKTDTEAIPYDEHLFPIKAGLECCMGAFDIVYENDYGLGEYREQNSPSAV